MTDITFQAADYVEIHNALLDLYVPILQNPSIDEVNTCAKHLGMWHNQALCIKNEVYEGLLMDYRLYAFRPNGFNMAEKYRRLTRDKLTEYQQALLAKMADAYYALYQDEAINDIGSIIVSDMFDKSQFTLVDPQLAEFVSAGKIFASHVIDFGEFAMQSGFALPVDDKQLILDNEVLNAMERIYADYHVLGRLNPANNAKLARAIISASLRLGFIGNDSEPQD
jgi:thymidylate kinase